MRVESFPPLARANARVLILGSMPGAESLRQQRYYAHPHNQFWPIMAELFGFDAALPYDARVAKILARGVAVWDVLKFCERPGSLDASIVRHSEVPHDFRRFFRTHPRVRAVFFNGGHSQQAFKRHVLPALGPVAAPLTFEKLPSTSPAHAGMSRARKLVAWQRIKEFL